MSTDSTDSTDIRVSITPNLVIGICVTVVGVALALDRLQIVAASQILKFWPLGLVLFGASLVVQALRGGNDAVRAQRAISPGHVVLLILLSVWVMQGSQRERGAGRTGTETSETVSLFAVMSADRRVSHAKAFHGGEMTSVMGGTQLDLRQASVAPGEEAVIDVFALMGGAVILVPEDWTVDVQVVPVMGGVKDERWGRRAGKVDVNARPPAPADAERQAETPPGVAGAAPRIVVRGFVTMGGLIVKS